jgi:hypothetical protein
MRARPDGVVMRKQRPARVDVERDAVEAIALEGFTPTMRRTIEKGERFPREHELVATYPAYFALLLPLTELNKGGEHGS